MKEFITSHIVLAIFGVILILAFYAIILYFFLKKEISVPFLLHKYNCSNPIGLIEYLDLEIELRTQIAVFDPALFKSEKPIYDEMVKDHAWLVKELDYKKPETKIISF